MEVAERKGTRGRLTLISAGAQVPLQFAYWSRELPYFVCSANHTEWWETAAIINKVQQRTLPLKGLKPLKCQSDSDYGTLVSRIITRSLLVTSPDHAALADHR